MCVFCGGLMCMCEAGLGEKVSAALQLLAPAHLPLKAAAPSHG